MIIGLTGLAGSGKNTAATILGDILTEFDYDVIEDSFAGRLKLSAARNFFPNICEKDSIEWCNQLKVTGKIVVTGVDFGCEITGRKFLQRYGTEAHREVFDQEFWVDQLFKDYPSLSPIEVLLITDARFPNEAKAIRAQGGKVWRINRDSIISHDAHASEVPLDDDLVDVEISNDGTFDELQEFLRLALLDRLFGRLDMITSGSPSVPVRGAEEEIAPVATEV